MQDPSVKDQSPPAAADTGRSSSRLLRYPLRSATRSKEQNVPPSDPPSNASAPRRGKPASSVSKSVNVLDLSSKDKPSKPQRRLSIPTKSTSSSAAKLLGSITPISEARSRPAKGQGKSDTPVSEISKSSNRRKFSAISSASYWLSHIKVSESSGKHSISLGFFKLALEAGCEPLSRMRDELKSYARRNNLSGLGVSVKEVFESYGILENLEQLQVSETCSHVPEEGTRSSDEETHSYSSVEEPQKLKPKSLNVEVLSTSTVKESGKEKVQRSNPKKVSSPGNRNSVNSRASENYSSTQKKSQKPNKQVIKREMEKAQGKQSVLEGQNQPSTAEEAPGENKENMDAPQVEEVPVAEA